MDPDTSRKFYLRSEHQNFSINSQGTKRFLFDVASYLKLKNCELGFTVVSKQKIKSLNSQYRGKNKSTDVLSFPLLDWKKAYDPRKHRSYVSCLASACAAQLVADMPLPLGDIVLCPEIAKTNAKNIGQSFDQEVRFLIVHSVLHLLGHDHMIPAEEKKMLGLQRHCMANLSRLENPRSRPLVKERVL